MKTIVWCIAIVFLTTLLNFWRFRYYLGVNPYVHHEQTTGTAININQVHYSLDQFQQTLVETIATSKESVVSIVVTKDFAYYYNSNPFSYFEDFFGWGNAWGQVVTWSREIGGGSGIFVHKDWYILTNKHVVNDPEAKYTVIFSNGKTAEAKKVWLDPKIDIAIIQIKNPEGYEAKPALALSIDDEVKVGQFAIAVGNTLAQYRNSVTLGIISGRNRQLWVENGNIYAGLYQTDTAISQGNSGGPLFDINGRVMGINTAVSSVWSNIGFAIPVTQEFINATLSSIQQYGKIVRPFLGIQYQDLSPSIAQELNISQEYGVYIQEIVANSPVAQEGIQKGDVLVSLDGKKIDENYPFLYQLYTHEVGDRVNVAVVRDGQEKKVEVVLE
jgi:serine protease Do